MRRLSRQIIILFAFTTLLTIGTFSKLPLLHGGEPAGDSVIKINCVGVLPVTNSCEDSRLSRFETLVYDTGNNGFYDSGDPVILGPIPFVGTVLVDNPKVMYRDNAPTNDIWDSGETIFYDSNGTLIGRVTLIGNPTASSTLIKHDPKVKIVDANNNGALDGIVRITARLERLGGTYTNGSQEDIDAIQVVYKYNPSILKPMRVSYGGTTAAPVLPDRGRFTTIVDNHCTANGSPLDSVVPDEVAGKISTSSLCQTPNLDVGLGCNPATRDPGLQGICPGDPATGGTTPLQDLDAVRVQFMVLGRGNFTIQNVPRSPGVSGAELDDLDFTFQAILSSTLFDGVFDNRLPGDQPPVATFGFYPSTARVNETFTFNGMNSTDPDGVLIKYDWDFGDGSTASAPTASHSYTQPGFFPVSLTVTDDAFLTDTMFNTVSVTGNNTAPIASFTVSPDQRLVNQVITFNATSSYDPDAGDSIVSYDWSFGDGGFGTGSVVNHNYTSVGVYTIILSVTDTHGAQDFTGDQILVTRIPYLPGVHVGDWARYTYSANFPGTSTSSIPVLVDFNVTAVTGTNVTISATALFSNGTTATEPISMDIRNFPLFLTAADLIAGDPISILLPFAINGTIPGTFVGATRNANYVSISYIGVSLDAKWDQPTGILLHYNETFQGPVMASFANTVAPEAVSSYGLLLELVDTNIWTPTENRLPVPIFTWNPQTAPPAQPIQFNATRSYDPDPGDTITSYSWNFGDGTTGTGVQTSHAYTTQGDYTVTLTVTDNNGASATTSQRLEVGEIHNVAVTQATASPTTTSVGQQVTIQVTVTNTGNFTETTTIVVVNSTTTLVSQSVTLSAGQTQIVTLTWDTTGFTAGTYTLTAIATPVLGETDLSDNSHTAGTVTLNAALTITISATPTRGLQPLDVSFTSTVSGGIGPYTYSWTFGDGGTSTAGGPSHTFTTAGTYTVTLAVRDSQSATATATTTVTVLPPLIASINASPILGPAPITVDFTGSATGGQSPYTFSWAFGDSATGTGATTSHTYQSAGSYTVTLTVRDSDGRTSQSTAAISATPVTGSLKIIVEDQSGKLISGAIVNFTSVPQGQTALAIKVTQSDGSVIYSDLVPGDYAYTITAGGYESSSKTSTVSAGTTPLESTVSLNQAPQPPSLPNVWLIGVAAAAIIVAAAILVLRRRKPKPVPRTQQNTTQQNIA